MGMTLKVIGGGLGITCVILFAVVGIPVTETFGPDGYSRETSWGHVVGYGAVGLVGAALIKVGEWLDQAEAAAPLEPTDVPRFDSETTVTGEPGSELSARDSWEPASETVGVIDIGEYCAACGTPHERHDSFCGECGIRLG